MTVECQCVPRCLSLLQWLQAIMPVKDMLHLRTDKKRERLQMFHLKFAPESTLVTSDTVNDAWDVAEMYLEILLKQWHAVYELNDAVMCTDIKYYEVHNPIKLIHFNPIKLIYFNPIKLIHFNPLNSYKQFSYHTQHHKTVNSAITLSIIKQSWPIEYDIRSNSSVSVRQRVTYKLAVSRSPINWLYWLTRCGPQPLQRISASWHRPVHRLGLCALPMLVVPRIHTKLARRVFSVAAPSTWNSLPADIRLCENIITFKRHLKTHLFKLT